MGLPPRATPAPAASLPRAVRPTTAQRGRLAVGRSTHVAAPAAGAAGLAAGLGAGAASEPAPPPEPRPLTPPPLSSFTLSDMVRWLCEWVRLFQKNQKNQKFEAFFFSPQIHLHTPSLRYTSTIPARPPPAMSSYPSPAHRIHDGHSHTMQDEGELRAGGRHPGGRQRRRGSAGVPVMDGRSAGDPDDAPCYPGEAPYNLGDAP